MVVLKVDYESYSSQILDQAPRVLMFVALSLAQLLVHEFSLRECHPPFALCAIGIENSTHNAESGFLTQLLEVCTDRV